MERLARLHGLLDEIHAETLSSATVEDAAVYAGLVEQAARKIDALAVAVIDSVDRSGLHKEDGFSTVQSWNAFVCRTTRGGVVEGLQHRAVSASAGWVAIVVVGR